MDVYFHILVWPDRFPMSTVSGSAVDPRCVAWCRHKVKLLGADVNALWRPEAR